MQPGTRRLFVLVSLAVFFTLGGALPFAMVCFVLLVAQFRLAGEHAKARGVILLASLAAAVVLGSPAAGLACGASAASGLPVAWLVERRWTFGWRLAAVSVVAFAAVAAYMLVGWQSLRHEMTIFLNARIAEWEASEISNEQVVEFVRWWDVNYAYLGFGSVFGSVVLLVSFMLSVLDRWQQAPETRARRKPTGFQRMQVPDWAVWVAITVAALWFVEDRWPNPALRFVTWNAALGLTFVYWLNGFSILLYALSVFKASAFATAMVFVGFVLFSSFLPALVVFGLFDTWFGFRTRFWRLALPHGARHQADDPDR